MDALSADCCSCGFSTVWIGGMAAARLSPLEASWSTASPFGDIHGAEAIEAFVETRLPARKFGPAYARHRMASAADLEDLTVVTPAGERCRFELEVATRPEGGASRRVIKRLVRQVL